MPRHSKDARSSGNGAQKEPLIRTEWLRRLKFAEGIARAEFGRHYWNGRLDEELREALRRPPRRN